MTNPFELFYTVDFWVCVMLAVFWYKAADVENVSPWLWVGMSVGVYYVTWRWLGWSWIGNIAGQAGLLAGITLWRAWQSVREQDEQSPPPP